MHKKIIITIIALFAAIGANAQSRIAGYTYWFDNDFAAVQTVSVSPAEVLSLNLQLSVAALSEGFHTLNFRSFDENGMWSGVLTKQFYRAAVSSGGANAITRYQYWLDNNFAEAVTTQAIENQVFVLDETLNLATLGEGFHTLNFRAADAAGKWSSVLTKQFYKMPIIAGGGEVSKIAAYTYWLGDDYENRVDVALETPVTNFVLLDNLDLNHVYVGKHLINFRFQDNAGRWSVVYNTEIEKECNLTYDLVENLNFCGQGNYTFPDGTVWYVDRDTTHVSNLLSKVGCDSTVFIRFDVLPLPEVPTYDPVTNVGEYTLPSVANGVWTNETGDVVTVAETSGVYTLTITGEGGCENSTTLTIEITSGIEEILAGKLVIYPNPVKEELIIENGELKVENVKIYDLSGREIVNYQLSTVNSINVSALPQGLYMLKIYTGSGVAVAKMIKE